GKSAFSVGSMYKLSEHFEVVIFRSLRKAPSCEALLDDCLQVLSSHSPGQDQGLRQVQDGGVGLPLQPAEQEPHMEAVGTGQAQGRGASPLPMPTSTERRICLLLEHLRKTRTLLVLDNLECLLAEGDVRGHFRPGFEKYGQLLRRVTETVHQSCLL